MKKFSIYVMIVGILGAFGIHYWELKHTIKALELKNWLLSTNISILKDEVNTLSQKRPYEQGVLDTVIRMKLDNGYSDGLLSAFSAIGDIDYVKGYHNAISQQSSVIQYNETQFKNKLEEAKREAFSSGRKSGYEEAFSDIKVQESHPDFTPRPKKEFNNPIVEN